MPHPRRHAPFAALALALLAAFAPAAARAELITVGQDGTTSFSTIQEAIWASAEGDEIVVYPGTYFENISFGGDGRTLRSTNPLDWDVVAATIIDGSQSLGPVINVTFSGSQNTISGFTIQNGSGLLSIDDLHGGGIYGWIYGHANATIQYNIIQTILFARDPLIGMISVREVESMVAAASFSIILFAIMFLKITAVEFLGAMV